MQIPFMNIKKDAYLRSSFESVMHHSRPFPLRADVLYGRPLTQIWTNTICVMNLIKKDIC